MRSRSADCRMVNRMQSATQSAMHNCAVGLGFRVCSPYCRGRDCGTPKPGKKKQNRYDYACDVLIIHRFPFSLLLTPVVRKVRLEVTTNDRDVLALSSPFFHEASLSSSKSLERVRAAQDPLRVFVPVQSHRRFQFRNAVSFSSA